MTKQFSNYSDLLTFTRASKGHALRPVSYGAELVTNGTFSTDSDWTKGTGWTISNGVADLDGSQGGNSDLSQSLTLKANAIYQLSVEVTAVTTALQYVTITNTGGPELQTLSETGTYTAIFVAPSTSEYLQIRGTSSSASTIDNVSVKEVLFDQPDGTLTLFEHPDNVPRVEYDADGNRLGLLVEESRTNLFTESEELSLKDHNMDTTDNAVIAPDRTQTASFCKPDTSSSEHFIDDAGVTTGTNYAISCFAKQGPGDYLLAFRGSGLGGNPPRFNLATGTIDNEGASSVWSDVKIQEIGNGWYRCSAVGNPNQSTPLRFQITESDGNGSFAGDGTSGLYIWGCQIEQASFPTSYIKSNSGSTTTRSADVASIPVADFGYNQSAGSLLFEFEKNNTDGAYLLDFEGSVSSQIQVVNDGDLRVRATRSPDVTLTLESPYVASVSTRKIAYTLKSGDHSAVLDGGSAQTSASTNATSEISTLYIGSDGGADLINGHIKSIKYYPRRLTNAQLVQLTS